MGYRWSLSLTLIGLVLTAAAYLGAMRTAIHDEPVQAWVWARALPRGEAVSADDLKPVTVLSRDLLPGMKVDPRSWKGKVTVVPTQGGQVVTERDVQASAPIPSGWETFYLAAGQNLLVDPDLIPGTAVNLLLSDQTTSGQPTAVRLPQGGIYLGSRAQDANRPPLIQVAVPAGTAEKLLTAESSGRLVRVLRSTSGQ